MKQTPREWLWHTWISIHSATARTVKEFSCSSLKQCVHGITMYCMYSTVYSRDHPSRVRDFLSTATLPSCHKDKPPPSINIFHQQRMVFSTTYLPYTHPFNTILHRKPVLPLKIPRNWAWGQPHWARTKDHFVPPCLPINLIKWVHCTLYTNIKFCPLRQFN